MKEARPDDIALFPVNNPSKIEKEEHMLGKYGRVVQEATSTNDR